MRLKGVEHLIFFFSKYISRFASQKYQLETADKIWCRYLLFQILILRFSWFNWFKMRIQCDTNSENVVLEFESYLADVMPSKFLKQCVRLSTLWPLFSTWSFWDSNGFQEEHICDSWGSIPRDHWYFGCFQLLYLFNELESVLKSVSA